MAIIPKRNTKQENDPTSTLVDILKIMGEMINCKIQDHSKLEKIKKEYSQPIHNQKCILIPGDG